MPLANGLWRLIWIVSIHMQDIDLRGLFRVPLQDLLFNVYHNLIEKARYLSKLR